MRSRLRKDGQPELTESEVSWPRSPEAAGLPLFQFVKASRPDRVLIRTLPEIISGDAEVLLSSPVARVLT
jgi:hypothetical protein